MKLLIIGNGSIGIEKDSKFYINSHTGYFLKKVNDRHKICFLQYGTTYNKDNNLQNYDLKEHNLKFVIAPKIKSLSCLPRLFFLLSKYQSVYIFYPGTLSRLVAFISILLRKPFGLYVRGQYFKDSFLDKTILKYARYVLTVSPTIADDLRKFCLDVDVIKPMISISLDDIKIDRVYTKKERWSLLFVGRVEYRKGIFDLLDIANNLRQKGLSFVMHIVGGGDSFLDVESIIKKNGLSDNIKVHGLVSDKDTLRIMYDQADCFIFTSHDEGFPRVLYEAMASGLPIFTTFVGGIPGRMIDGENCFEIPIKSPIEAADIIFRKITDISHFETVARNAQIMLRNILSGKLSDHSELVLRKIDSEK